MDLQAFLQPFLLWFHKPEQKRRSRSGVAAPTVALLVAASWYVINPLLGDFMSRSGMDQGDDGYCRAQSRSSRIDPPPPPPGHQSLCLCSFCSSLAVLFDWCPTLLEAHLVGSFALWLLLWRSYPLSVDIVVDRKSLRSFCTQFASFRSSHGRHDGHHHSYCATVVVTVRQRIFGKA